MKKKTIKAWAVFTDADNRIPSQWCFDSKHFTSSQLIYGIFSKKRYAYNFVAAWKSDIPRKIVGVDITYTLPNNKKSV